MALSHFIEDRPPRVLFIEDAERDRAWLRTHLEADCYEVRDAVDGAAGLAACRADPPDLVLLDLGLPIRDGFETLRRLKEDYRTRAVPVIVISEETEPEDKVQGLDLGAVDYVTKPFDPIELRARIRVALRAKRMQDLLEQRAHVDGLTGLANRLALEERLTTEWAVHQRHGGALAVWVADLDHFKAVNDTFGHPAGDEVLRRAAALLRSSVRAGDTTARYGGEEFVVIAPRCDLAGAVKTAERFRDRLAGSPVVTAGAVIRVTVSVGVASWPEGLVGSPAALLAAADKAVYQAKARGRNTVELHRSGVDTDTGGKRLVRA